MSSRRKLIDEMRAVLAEARPAGALTDAQFRQKASKLFENNIRPFVNSIEGAIYDLKSVSADEAVDLAEMIEGAATELTSAADSMAKLAKGHQYNDPYDAPPTKYSVGYSRRRPGMESREPCPEGKHWNPIARKCDPVPPSKLKDRQSRDKKG